MIKKYHEFVEELNYTDVLHRSMATLLIDNGFDIDEAKEFDSVFLNNIEPPSNNDELLKLYLIKEELNNDVNEYEKLFGRKYLNFTKFLMDNIATLYYSAEKRISSMYREYEEKALRKQAADHSDKKEEVLIILSEDVDINAFINELTSKNEKDLLFTSNSKVILSHTEFRIHKFSYSLRTKRINKIIVDENLKYKEVEFVKQFLHKDGTLIVDTLINYI